MCRPFQVVAAWHILHVGVFIIPCERHAYTVLMVLPCTQWDMNSAGWDVTPAPGWRNVWAGLQDGHDLVTTAFRTCRALCTTVLQLASSQTARR